MKLFSAPNSPGLFCNLATMKPFGFGKAEKLKSRKAIDALFADGQSLAFYPVRVKFRFIPFDKAPVQAGVSASKKTFKRAADRNRIKRLLREAFRLQKQALLAAVAEKKVGVVIFFIYTGNEVMRFKTIFEAVGSCLKQVQKNVLAYENSN